MTITRAAALFFFFLSLPVHATEPPTVHTSAVDDVSIAVHSSQCLDGTLSAIRQTFSTGEMTTQLGYGIVDTCGNGELVAFGSGPVPHDVLTGSGKTSLRVVADTRKLPDIHAEGQPIVIDMTWTPTDGDFTVSSDKGRSLNDGVVSRFSGEHSTRAAVVTGTVSLFVPTEAAIGWSRGRTLERDVK